MKFHEKEGDELKNIVQEDAADYKKAELDLLRHALTRSYTERFKTMMTLMKMNIMFRNAKITHPGQSSSNNK